MSRIYKLNGLDIERLLRLEGYNEGFIKRNSLNFHVLLTRILYRYFHKSKKFGNGYVKLNTEQLKKVIGRYATKNTPSFKEGDTKQKYGYLLIRKLLYQWGVILHRTPIKNNKSIAFYKIRDEWLDKGFELYRGLIPKQLKENIEKYKEANTVELTGVQQFLFDSYNRVQFDKESATKWLKKAYADKLQLRDKQGLYGKWENKYMDDRHFSFYQMFIDEWGEKRYFYVAKSGRLYTSITNMPSVFRQFLSFESNEKLIEVDQKNCQPLLLSHIDSRVDDNYRELCEQGEFYSYLEKEMRQSGINMSDKGSFKVDFFSKVFFDTEKRNNKYKEIFKDCFPNTYDVIQEIKKDDYKELSHQLQTKESQLLMRVCSILRDEYGVENILTIHDSVMVEERFQGVVEQVMNEVFLFV